MSLTGISLNKARKMARSGKRGRKIAPTDNKRAMRQEMREKSAFFD